MAQRRVPVKGNFRAVQVDWEQAGRYCRWLGKRLPTEAEWEKAARGGCEIGGDPDSCEDPEDERIFPWGHEEPTCEQANFCLPGCCVELQEEVGTRPLDASPYWVLHMADNVSEWTADWFDRDYYSTGGPPWVDPKGPPQEGDCGHVGCGNVGRGYVAGGNVVPLTTRGGGKGWGAGTGFRCAGEPL